MVLLVFVKIPLGKTCLACKAHKVFIRPVVAPFYGRYQRLRHIVALWRRETACKERGQSGHIADSSKPIERELVQTLLHLR